MKTPEEFRHIVFEKAERHEKERRIRNRKLRDGTILFSVCIVLVATAYFASTSFFHMGKSAPANENAPVQPYSTDVIAGTYDKAEAGNPSENTQNVPSIGGNGTSMSVYATTYPMFSGETVIETYATTKSTTYASTTACATYISTTVCTTEYETTSFQNGDENATTICATQIFSETTGETTDETTTDETTTVQTTNLLTIAETTNNGAPPVETTGIPGAPLPSTSHEPVSTDSIATTVVTSAACPPAETK